MEPVEIQHVKLRRRLLGLDRGEVDRLLENVTASYEEVWLERDKLRASTERLRIDAATLRAEVERLRHELEEVRAREREMGDVLVIAQRAAQETVAEARTSAETILVEAHREAEEIVGVARREPERVLEEIRRLEAVESEIRARLGVFLAGVQGLLEEDGSGTESQVEVADRAAVAASR
jgi:cell division septum initiation protein DivIVA